MPKSNKQDKDYEFILQLEKTIEEYLCQKNKLSLDKVREFEIRYEEMRRQFPDIVKKAPGDDEASPHFHFHQIATRVGRWLGDTLKIDWSIYGR